MVVIVESGKVEIDETGKEEIVETGKEEIVETGKEELGDDVNLVGQLNPISTRKKLRDELQSSYPKTSISPTTEWTCPDRLVNMVAVGSYAEDLGEKLVRIPVEKDVTK